MHRKICLILIAVAVTALPGLAQTSKLNGTWKLNNSKSNFGTFPPPASETDSVTITGSDFKQQVTTTNQQGNQSYTRACTIDGKDTVLSPDNPNAHIGRITLSKIMCGWQGSSLVVTETASLQGSDLTDKLTFSPSDDGNTMTMDSHITSATINGDRKLVYDKADASAAAMAPAGAAPMAATPGAAAMIHAGGGDPPNLSGTWKLNLTKSNFGQGAAPASQTDTIVDNEPSVKINADQKGGFMGDTNITTSLSTDGKETTSPGMGGSEVKSTAHWEGNSLVVNAKADFQGSPITIKDGYSLSADGKTLTEVTHVESGMGNFDTTSVYDKQ
ncbi:MAG TPA: hypothetical protein VN822_11485 [Candidatus Acidoferrales bacterium]|nr:hypothetical protein [Candidatus Acidoferrales bacterium]